MSVHYDVDGLGHVEHMLMGMAARAIETRPLLEMFAQQLREITQDTFEAEGPGWEPLSPATVAKKGSTTIGRETDAMMESLVSEGEGHIEEFFGEELIFGTHLTNEEGFPYPVAFDQGTRNQPARPIFDIQEHDLRRFTKSVQAWLVGADRSEFGVGSFGMGLTSPFGV